MVNVLYDFDLGGRWGASLGVGAGGNQVSGKGGFFFGNHIDDYVLAGQLIGELNYQISDRWQLFGTYRFMFMEDPDMGASQIFGPGGSVEIQKDDHAVMIGLRFDLTPDHAPAPEPERPMPARPSAPHQFIVFFGFNKSNLS